MSPASHPTRPRLRALGLLAWIALAAPGDSAAATAPPTSLEGHVHEDMSSETPTPAPLSPAQRTILLASAEDAAPERLGGVTEARQGAHYVTGNEHGLHAFHERVRGLGGGYIGVGAEQAYLLIGWSRAELAWQIDYDPEVVDIHAVHHALIAAADTPAEYLALWHKPRRRDAIALVRAAYPGEAGARRVALLRQHRSRVARRLDELQAEMLAAGVPCFLDDPGDYAHVRALVLGGRVRALTADLTREGAVVRVAAAARSLGVRMRVIYLSNAEEYWERLPPEFRGNLRALPVDARSVVLRTLLTWEDNRDYLYNAQSAHNYRRWLVEPDLGPIYDVVRKASAVVDERGFFETRALPDPGVLRRREQRRREKAAAPLATP